DRTVSPVAAMPVPGQELQLEDLPEELLRKTMQHAGMAAFKLALVNHSMHDRLQNNAMEILFPGFKRIELDLLAQLGKLEASGKNGLEVQLDMQDASAVPMTASVQTIVDRLRALVEEGRLAFAPDHQKPVHISKGFQLASLHYDFVRNCGNALSEGRWLPELAIALQQSRFARMKNADSEINFSPEELVRAHQTLLTFMNSWDRVPEKNRLSHAGTGEFLKDLHAYEKGDVHLTRFIEQPESPWYSLNGLKLRASAMVESGNAAKTAWALRPGGGWPAMSDAQRILTNELSRSDNPRVSEWLFQANGPWENMSETDMVQTEIALRTTPPTLQDVILNKPDLWADMLEKSWNPVSRKHLRVSDMPLALLLGTRDPVPIALAQTMLDNAPKDSISLLLEGDAATLEKWRLNGQALGINNNQLTYYVLDKSPFWNPMNAAQREQTIRAFESHRESLDKKMVRGTPVGQKQAWHQLDAPAMKQMLDELDKPSRGQRMLAKMTRR
ncbi:MAG: hypothetical protein ACRYF5_04095, partial [Janthinobacterium lividum]